jgi:cytochrome P450
VVGYEEARQVLNSASFGVAGQMELLLSARPYCDLADDSKRLFRNALLFTDPPLHTRLRSAISRAFTPRQMARLEPRIRTLVDRLLDEVRDDPTPDLVRAIIEPLPIQVIGELIGVPEERWSWLSSTSTILRTMLDTFTVVDPVLVDATCTEITAYCGELADRRLAAPEDDVISVLAHEESEGHIDRPELVSLLVILLLAGHETTTGALGNALVALGRNPEQRELVRRTPALWPNAVEELLRYDTVVQTDPRAALEDVTVGGRTIKQGQNLTIMLGAVNRDPRRFDAPDSLRLDRDDPAPLSFGHGIHHCIGAALVRAEMRVALPAVLEAFGDYAIDEGRMDWKRSIAFRGPSAMPIERDVH